MKIIHNAKDMYDPLHCFLSATKTLSVTYNSEDKEFS